MVQEMGPRVLNLLPEEERALCRLWLNATDAAKVCGITVRQLTYWTDKGIIPSSSHNGRSYSIAALDKAMAIDRAMAGGLTLEKAARQVERSARAAGAREGNPSTGVVGEIDGLVSLLGVYRRSLSAHLAMANFRRAAAALVAIEIDRALAGAEDPGEVGRLLAARLNAVAGAVDGAAREIGALQPSRIQINEVVSAGRSGS